MPDGVYVQYKQEDFDDLAEVLQSHMPPNQVHDRISSNLLAVLLNYKWDSSDLVRNVIYDRVSTRLAYYMFDIPLDDMPLYINKDINMTELMHMVVKWRLRRGR